jgi:hypothetical protein
MVTLSEPQLDLAKVSIRFSPLILKILVFALPKLVWLHIAKVRNCNSTNISFFYS